MLEDLRMPVGLTGLLFTVLLVFVLKGNFLTTLTLAVALLTIFKTAGLAACVLLLIQSLDVNNALVQKLCGSDDPASCNAILSSKAARVGILSWSEAGFFYFAGTWLTLLFSSGHTAILQALAILNIISLPYTFYSINYQWRVAKQWCIFCCTVQALLWFEFFCFIPYLSNFRMPDAHEWQNLAAGMLLPVFAWIVTKPYFLQLTQLAPLAEQLRLFKYNKELFEAALKSQPKYAVPDDDWSIVLGNVEAPNVVVMVSNPYCQPCAYAHAQIEEALTNYSDMQVRVVFNGRNTDEQNAKTRVHRHLMALNVLGDKSVVRSALHDWYAQKQKNYEAWAQKYPAILDTANNDKLERQRAWVAMTGITGTPTLLLNGYQLPRTYQLKELKYMLSPA